MVDRFVYVPDSGELPTTVKVPVERLSDASPAGKAFLKAETAEAQRNLLELGAGGPTGFTVLGQNDPVPEGSPAGSVFLRFGGSIIGDLIAPIVADITTQRSTTGDTLMITKPANVVNGDYLVAVLHAQFAGTTAQWTSAGWDTIARYGDAEVNGLRNTKFMALPVLDAGSLPASWTFASQTGSARNIGFVFRIQGVDLNDPVVKVGGMGSAGTNAATLPTTDVPAGSLTLAAFVGQATSTTVDQFPSTLTGADFIKVQELATLDNLSATRSALTLWSRQSAEDETIPAITSTWSSISTPAGLHVVLRGKP